MREIKFDYALEIFDQGKTSRKRLTFGYVDIFNGTAKRALDAQASIGYAIIAKRQYTGLKDKNDVEIYEGDIFGKRPYGYLKSDGNKDGRYKGKEWDCWAIEWGHWAEEDLGLVSGYEYETDGKVAGWNITFDHQAEYDDDLKNYEVIGNIHESPELLESK